MERGRRDGAGQQGGGGGGYSATDNEVHTVTNIKVVNIV